MNYKVYNSINGQAPQTKKTKKRWIKKKKEKLTKQNENEHTKKITKTKNKSKKN